MKKIFHLTFYIIFLAFSVIGCKNSEENTPSSADAASESEKLTSFFEHEFQRDLEDSPMLQTRLGIKTSYDSWDSFSHLRHAKELEKAKKRLSFLKDSVNAGLLNEQDALSYKLYRQKLENEIEDYDFRFYNYPVNQMFGVHAEIPAFLINMHRIDSVSDAKAYIARMEKLPALFKDVAEAMQLREFNQIMPPKFVYDHTIEASRNVITGKPFQKSTDASALLVDFKQKVEDLDISSEEKDALMNRAQEVMINSVQPAYEIIIAALEDQRQRATNEAGAWKFPKGKAFYNNALKRITTTDLTADEIHELGLSEVARIHREMEAIMEEVEFEGSLQDFFHFMRTDEQFYYKNTPEGKEKYLTEATGLINTMKDRLEELFLTLPEADIQVKAVEPFREKSAGKAFYSAPAIDGTRPGIYYANLYDMEAMPTYQMEALAYHEGIPGHHMQIAISQELEDIPMFRKMSFYTAYVEGWGLYSEILPKEIGFYEDPYSDFGRLAMELWRSIRLVVDTGIHARKWTREEAIEYYTKNSPNAESDAVKMVERHIVMPGQATAYKVGMNKILELREKAKKELGDDFDIRKFHDVILLDGALPLNLLEEKVNDWIAEEKN
ncbi:DUF885 domain-containing protein [Salinimicrobium marinum]|nr:DUF885 domain-containing protein [Salinimicrobium marinum]